MVIQHTAQSASRRNLQKHDKTDEDCLTSGRWQTGFVVERNVNRVFRSRMSCKQPSPRISLVTETGKTLKRTEELSENNFHDHIRCHNDSKHFYARVVCRARYKKQNHQLSLKKFNKILKCILYSLFLSCWKRRPLQ